MKTYDININGKTFKVEVLNVEGADAQVSVNGQTYSAKVEGLDSVAPKPRSIKRVGTSTAAAIDTNIVSTPNPVAQKGAINSPLPGTILSIGVTVGQSVKRGDKLLVLEAMKMENDVLSDRDGTISQILVNQGASVQEGQTLIVIG